MSSGILGLGGLFLYAALIADITIRLRMWSIGRKGVFFRNSTFRYAEYLEVCTKRGWAAWPVYFMWTALIFGILLLAIGSRLRFAAR
jgi:hypothetical protein